MGGPKLIMNIIILSCIIKTKSRSVHSAVGYDSVIMQDDLYVLAVVTGGKLRGWRDVFIDVFSFAVANIITMLQLTTTTTTTTTTCQVKLVDLVSMLCFGNPY